MRALSVVLLAITSQTSLAQLAQSPQRVPIAQPWPSDTSWRHIGPAAFGGRVDDIEAVPGDPRIIFVASASGGVFRSKNNGTTWDATFDKYGNTMSIGDIAIAPSNPRVIWAGTGEPNNRQSSTWGDGVYRSIDGGDTWQHMGLRETQTIGRIVIDPRDANIVFVAAVGHLFGPNDARGLYRTKDGGASWQKVLSVDANTGATDVVISPDGRTLVAATYQRRRREFGFAGSGPGSGLWRSTDGGDTWQRITTGMPTGDMGRIGLDISASNPRRDTTRASPMWRSTGTGMTTCIPICSRRPTAARRGRRLPATSRRGSRSRRSKRIREIQISSSRGRSSDCTGHSRAARTGPWRAATRRPSSSIESSSTHARTTSYSAHTAAV
jgi:photosystem II stability/assembly factor-like uncharacterized protein